MTITEEIILLALKRHNPESVTAPQIYDLLQKYKVKAARSTVYMTLYRCERAGHISSFNRKPDHGGQNRRHFIMLRKGLELLDRISLDRINIRQEPFTDKQGYHWLSVEDQKLFGFDAYGILPAKRKRCVNCGRLSYKYQRVNGGPVHCWDGCFNTTGIDRRKEKV